jgi:hypothetical protein
MLVRRCRSRRAALMARLGTVGVLAQEQCMWLKEHVPATASSRNRSLWDVLCEEVETRQRLLVQRRYLREPHLLGQP